MCKGRHLPRAFETSCGPLGPDDLCLGKNLSVDLTSVQTARTALAVTGRILDSGGLVTIFAELELAGLEPAGLY